MNMMTPYITPRTVVNMLATQVSVMLLSSGDSKEVNKSAPARGPIMYKF